MSAPHEEEWKAIDSGQGCFHVWNGKEVVAREVAKEQIGAITAAPDMARALLRFRNAHLGQDSAEEIEQALLDAEAALIKAGVPLP